ncbi:GNAT family N-acetyltransferase [Shimazuella kribbensis]|uniref:GNAT family N-acetyltransferase n=1 Tax=Shimazuella kribbensis TaxID=139808 RepID=UPI000417BA8D|nr:GNAT family N-acetyltransferase [Shimazuella kribbensis]
MKVCVVTNTQQLQDALSVRHRVFVEEQNISSEFDKDEYDGSATHVVIYDKEVPVATGRYRVVKDMAKIERIAVLSSYRGNGVGKMVMAELEQAAKKRGLACVILDAQAHAENFYEKLGYQSVSGIFMKQSIPHLEMKKRLTKEKVPQI